MKEEEKYMFRCLELAEKGRGSVSPNPMVGAVLVHEGRIIGEGYHHKFGEAHAEIKAFQAVEEADRKLLAESTLYVSLEPCAHYGKTPPCVDRIIAEGISKVIIGIRDPFPLVNGKGIEKLLEAGVKVTCGILNDECYEINKRFFTSHLHQRPYIILKWAQSIEGNIAQADYKPVAISQPITNRLVHKWRSEEDAILVGSRTAMSDDPQLNTRLWPGKNPLRCVLDPSLRLPLSLKLFDGSQKTVVFNTRQQSEDRMVSYEFLSPESSLLPQLLESLQKMGIQSVIVEGGAGTIDSFIREDLWDEIRLITSSSVSIAGGLKAPTIPSAILKEEIQLGPDTIRFFQRNKQLK
jgi:diaminohydroxyphosphoribosylaminopyrimidine deaminase / 5-amino-6-(5-phosphoribosylamino)uracil reductase